MNTNLLQSFSLFRINPEIKFPKHHNWLKHFVVLIIFVSALFTTKVSYAQTATKAPCASYVTPQVFTVNKQITPLVPTNNCGAVPASIYGLVSTYAGSGTVGSANGIATAASFNGPNGITTDASGNTYVADISNHLIRKITPSGVVSTFAGSGTQGFADGTGISASFNYPAGLAIDASGNVYVADQINNRIRIISPAGVVSTLAGSGTRGYADGTGSAASFNSPTGVALDGAGNVYVADWSNQRIRKISPAGVVTTLAGSSMAGYADGVGVSAKFNYPYSVATDAAGNVYVADRNNQLIRKISPLGDVSTIAGNGVAGYADGNGLTASFNNPNGLTIDATGNIYVADAVNNRIRVISPMGIVSTLAGSGTAGYVNGTSNTASFNYPRGIALDGAGNLMVADVANNLIRKISLTGYSISPAIPAGLSFDSPTGTISGTPTVTSPATTYTIIAYNLAGSSSATINITVNNLSPCASYVTPQVFTVNKPITPLIPTNNCGAVPVTTYGKVTLLRRA